MIEAMIKAIFLIPIFVLLMMVVSTGVIAAFFGWLYLVGSMLFSLFMG